MHRPHPVHQRIPLPLNRAALQHIHCHHGVPALAQVDQRERELGVQQGRERDDDRPGWDGGPGRECSGSGFEGVSYTEHRVEDPVELPLSDVGTQPAGSALSQSNQTRPVAVPQGALYHLRRPTGSAFHRLGRRARRLRIGVEEHDDISRAIGQPLGDVQGAATCADRPVDRSKEVAGDVGTDVGVFDTGAMVAGEMGAQPVEQFGARNRGGLRWGHGEYADLGGIDGADPVQQSSAAGHPHGSADRVAAPSWGTRVDDPGRHRLEMDSCRAGARHRDGRVVVRGGGDDHAHRLVFEAPVEWRLRLHRHRRRTTLPPDRTQHAEQGCREHHEVRTAGEHSTAQCHGRARRHCERQRRCTPTQFDLDHRSARGTGVRRSSSSTTSVPCTRRTHISGRRLIRCAMVGTARALTSSGMT